MVQFSGLDDGFGALADATRRGILVALGRGGGASITALADEFDMTLTGIKKHVQILEDAKLVTTAKSGRVRTCHLGPRKLNRELQFINAYQHMLGQRLDSLEDFLERTKEK
ncbi:MAG TPA: metalloregulator ArsR/SmtB family transcription factor [Myxococcota bacterium]|jgi:DNA-binding transcriptional ArsR family regulator